MYTEPGVRWRRDVRTRSFPCPRERTGGKFAGVGGKKASRPVGWGLYGAQVGAQVRASSNAPLVSLPVTPSPTPAFYPSWLNENGLVCLVSNLWDSKVNRRGAYSSNLCVEFVQPLAQSGRRAVSLTPETGLALSLIIVTPFSHCFLGQPRTGPHLSSLFFRDVI